MENTNANKLTNKHEKLKVMLGTWIGGNCLTHLQLIDPSDATDPDVAAILAQIKSHYYSGITRGATITVDDKAKLLDAIVKQGYSRDDVCTVAQDAIGKDMDYITAVARLLEQKRMKMLQDVDWEKPGADKRAAEILKTYTVEGTAALKTPAVNPATELIEECKALSNAPIIPAGTELLTRYTGGYKPGTLVAIGAGTSVGKTAFALQVAETAAKEGKKVLYVTVEVKASEMSGRQIARATNGKITNKELNRITKLDPEQINMINEAAAEVNEMAATNLIWLEGERELSQIKRQVELHQPDLIVVDQISLIRDMHCREDTIRLQYKHIVEELKFMAMDTQCVVLLVAQINRTGLAKSKGDASMHDFQESSAIEQTADVCLVLVPVVEDENEEAEAIKQELEINPRYRNLRIKVDKNRYGFAGYKINAQYDTWAQEIYDMDETFSTELYPEPENEAVNDGTQIEGFEVISDEEIPF